MAKKAYFFTGKTRDLHWLRLPVSEEGVKTIINGNGCHILICFGQIYYYIRNEISAQPNDWHKEVIRLLEQNELVMQVETVDIYGKQKKTKTDKRRKGAK